ncbi:hypothetical protein SAMN05444359_112128 [Neolewinella agarilytica]|uniref:Uncharacterized protein n=1 Tax=Neolewinella agarilytica TaxID=478744 RepID=A0A1H9HEB4_9BACT|nr:hypothetical protein SAMN05444359_112128 [Neolewinella agarilytica]
MSSLQYGWLLDFGRGMGLGSPGSGALSLDARKPQAWTQSPGLVALTQGWRFASRNTAGDHGQPSKEKNRAKTWSPRCFERRGDALVSGQCLSGVDRHSARDKGLQCPARAGGRDHEPPEGERPRKKASTARRAFLCGLLTGGGSAGVAAETDGPCAL